QEFDEKIESLAALGNETQGTPQTIEHDITDASHQCELYVEDDPPRLVAVGRVFEGGLTIHGVPLQPDWTRVVVDEVNDANAPVPFPNEEIQLVGQASGTFLAWPRRRDRVEIQWDVRVFGIDNSSVPLYISLPDALEIAGEIAC
ncbi:unnamed protein product, partial [Sphenostylis stenocarpa]